MKKVQYWHLPDRIGKKQTIFQLRLGAVCLFLLRTDEDERVKEAVVFEFKIIFVIIEKPVIF